MKLGFIGCGNMANAMIAGIIGNGICKAEEIIGTAKSEESRVRVNKEFGIYMTEDNKEAAEKADVIVLSVKPQFYEEVICEIKDVMKDNQIVVTIAPGKTLAWLEEKFGKPVKLVRTMSNTPAYKFAAKAVMGSAKMVLETGKHPGELKDMVCSPAGTTIEAVKVLEAAGFRSALMEAMEVCAEKSRNM